MLMFHKPKNKLTKLFAEFTTLEPRQKTCYAMHTIKITPNLLFEYQCTSGKFIRLPNRIEKIDSVVRIESKLFARIGMLYWTERLKIHLTMQCLE